MIAFLAIFLGASILIPVLHRWLRNVTFLAAAIRRRLRLDCAARSAHPER
ncbi:MULTISPECIES: hypothetical protein [unclassified Pseudoclavibacter]|nr:hypothetical protein [Pseudoclavibacter sp. Marseille-Q4354]